MKERVAVKADLQEIMGIVKEAQAFLKEQGIDQWQDGYPDEAVILADLEKNESFVFEEDGDILAYMTVTNKPEMDYHVLNEGKWFHTGENYGAMHHVAVSKKARGKGISERMFALGKKVCIRNGKASMRIDTHPDNMRMQHVIEKNGLKKCGWIRLSYSGDIRFVYETLLV